MPFRPHIRCTAIGKIGTGAGVEKFQYGLNLVDNDPGWTPESALQPNLDYWADVAGDFAAFHGRATTAIVDICVLQEVKFAAIGADGKYTKDPIIIDVADVPGAAVTPTNAVPNPQDAVAVTLHTALRGKGSKGRFYVPMPAMPVSRDTLLFGVNQAEDMRNSAVQLIDDINNAPGIDVLGLEVHLISTKGTSALITGVSVGRVMDTIRTRRRQIPESRTAVAAVQSPGE